MGAFFVYSLKSSICLAAFYLFYKLLLSRDTFHRFNRIALIGTMILSAMIPVAAIFLLPPVRPFETIMDSIPETFGFVNPASSVMTEISPPNRLLSLILLIYLTGCGVFFIRSILTLFRILRIIRIGNRIRIANNIRLVTHHDNRIAPFSWMNYIVASQTDMNEAGDTILLHEQAHISQHHTYDLLLAELCILFQWYNPAAWLLFRELQHIHEFEADQSVLDQGTNAKQYQLLLIKKAVGTRLYSMANSLNHSNLKKRITMMLQKKSSSWARLKYAYVLPLAAISVIAFARPEISQPFDEISNAKVSNLIWKVEPPEVEKISPEEIPIADFAPSVTQTNETAALSESAKPEAPPVQPLIAPVEARPVQQNPNAAARSQASDTTQIFVIVDQHPEFPGGSQAMMDFISQNIRYPEKAKVEGVYGRVTVSFVVEKDGSTSNVEVIRGVDPELDKEALRLVRSMPKWMPGKKQGQDVRVRFTLPVQFRLPDQTPPAGQNTNSSTQSKVSDPDVFVVVEQHPEFPGGTQAMMEYIKQNIRYPEKAKKEGIYGRVTVSFIVEKDGSLSNVEIIRGVDPELDAEAIRLVQSMPKWKPGKDKGQDVRVRFTLPVQFTLPK